MLTNLALTALLLASAPPVEAQTLDGQTVTGTIVSLDAEGATLQTGDGPVTVGTDRLKSLSPGVAGAETPGEPKAWIETVDGCRLVAAGYTTEEGRAQVAAATGGVLEVPTSDLVAVRLAPEVEALTAEWSKLAGSAPEKDLLVVAKDEVLDYHRGIIGDVTEALVRFDLDGDVLPVKRAKVYGLVYAPIAAREFPDAVCRITEAGGSSWAARSITLEGDQLQWTTPAGLEVARPLAGVVRIDFSEGKVLYLSDLDTESEDWTPFLGSPDVPPLREALMRPRRDRSLDGGPLLVDGRTYPKGLAIHSRTEIVWRLPGRFRRFKATAGIDDRVRPEGNVKLVIRGDDAVLVEKTLSGTTGPEEIDVDMTGVRRLAVLVDFGEDGDFGDHLDLCEARVLK